MGWKSCRIIVISSDFDTRLFIILFLTSSLGVIVLYWSWYAYYSYDSDRLVYEDQSGLCLGLTLIFLLLLGPVCLNYRNIELTLNPRGSEGNKRTRGQSGRQRNRDRERSPPPKYQETLAGSQTSRS